MHLELTRTRYRSEARRQQKRQFARLPILIVLNKRLEKLQGTSQILRNAKLHHPSTCSIVKL